MLCKEMFINELYTKCIRAILVGIIDIITPPRSQYWKQREMKYELYLI